ncbi:hypothetical protein [Paraburkholderia humisilvae]|uniref:Uncharacterized protein n=1 Tax=Paraburkholderia humisilvae TaxID=627669 RepID=A0A6J5FAZ3_9BURK|nr:hypothetical protein [Paraburkholderia humisilvae]CAB3774396.1 hypothetical protein LMG29542_07778 [Paraburkholderia humisilvae]
MLDNQSAPVLANFPQVFTSRAAELCGARAALCDALRRATELAYSAALPTQPLSAADVDALIPSFAVASAGGLAPECHAPDLKRSKFVDQARSIAEIPPVDIAVIAEINKQAINTPCQKTFGCSGYRNGGTASYDITESGFTANQRVSAEKHNAEEK